MSASGYTAWSVTAGEIPTTAYWNLLGSNDASFNTGTGINDGAILTRHLAANNVTKITYVYNEVFATAGQTLGTGSFADVAGWTAGTVTTTGGDLILHINYSYWRGTSGVQSNFRIQFNGSTNYPSNSGWVLYTNELSSHKPASRTLWITGLPASTYTIKMQAQAVSSGTTNFDGADALNMVAVEYLK